MSLPGLRGVATLVVVADGHALRAEAVLSAEEFLAIRPFPLQVNAATAAGVRGLLSPADFLLGDALLFLHGRLFCCY